MKRYINIIILLILSVALSACSLSKPEENTKADEGVISHPGAKTTIRMVSGSENKELTHLIERFVKEYKVNIDIDYMGSLDIMRLLGNDTIEYDAVWPASSIWVSMGDVNHKVKHMESTSITPVVFGIRDSLAEELNFKGREVSVVEIMDAIKNNKLSFTMTSATQSNSGASAYIGFLYALLGNPDIISMEDLQSPKLNIDIKELLGGVERSSGSSEWLKTMFLEGDYDAMVNYESLIITTNQQLVDEGREPLYVVYPYDGLSISDSPLGYIDNGEKDKEEAFLQLQEFLLSDDIQNEIQKTGRRTGYNAVNEENKSVFNEDWGIDTKRILSPITMPARNVITEALNLYQTEFRKPSLTIYALDFSGSMSGKGEKQLKEAMSQILIQENASKHFLQSSENEINIALPFSSDVISEYKSTGNSAEMEELYYKIERTEANGGTDMYKTLIYGFDVLEKYDLNQYNTAIILLTDGMSEDRYADDFKEIYEELDCKVPIFSIMFGDADDEQLKEVATFTNARVFDGRTNLINAFRSVKGYN